MRLKRSIFSPNQENKPLLKKVVNCFALLSALSLSFGCEVNQDELDAIANAFSTDSASLQSRFAIPESCEKEQFQQPPAVITKKLDLLFVADTSGSLNQERADIASGIDAFINALPSDVDYQIGVMLAHSPLSQYSGRLYQKGSEPHVLASSSLDQTDIRSYLVDKLSHIQSEWASDGGEEGLVSLNQSLSGTKFDEIRNHGFYRDDAALAVVFIADENDICADYPNDVTPVPDGQNIEPGAKVRDCTNVSPQSVLNQLKTLKANYPLVVSGIIYNNLATVPNGGENEFGYGYSDIIKLANGLAIDLADGHYQEGLESIGQLATVEMVLNSEFALQGQAGEEIDTASVQVYVDGAAVPFAYLSDLSQVNLTEELGQSNSIIDVTYCFKEPEPSHPKVSASCQAGSFSPKSGVHVGLSIDSGEGSQNTIIAGLQGLGINPTIYADAEVASGQPTTDGTTVLIISRKVTLQPVSQAYIDGVIQFINDGGSVLGEYDGAALFFDEFTGDNPAIPNLSPSLDLFSGHIDGGGALLPIETSTTYVTDPFHPVTQGLPSSFLNGLRTAFSITDYDADWLHPVAEFTSQGTLNQVPLGTYPSVLAGRCGPSRVTLYMMNHLQVTHQQPVDTLVDNTLQWLVGNTN